MRCPYPSRLGPRRQWVRLPPAHPGGRDQGPGRREWLTKAAFVGRSRCVRGDDTLVTYCHLLARNLLSRVRHHLTLCHSLPPLASSFLCNPLLFPLPGNHCNTSLRSTSSLYLHLHLGPFPFTLESRGYRSSSAAPLGRPLILFQARLWALALWMQPASLPGHPVSLLPARPTTCSSATPLTGSMLPVFQPFPRQRVLGYCSSRITASPALSQWPARGSSPARPYGERVELGPWSPHSLCRHMPAHISPRGDDHRSSHATDPTCLDHFPTWGLAFGGEKTAKKRKSLLRRSYGRIHH